MLNAISVLFSGGPDSTLAVLYALEKAQRVHLVTFHHRLMGTVGKHKKVTAELKKIYGNDRIIEHEEKIDKFFNKFYITKIHKKISHYRTFYIPWLCGACKLAMHFRTIVYNKKHAIPVTYDGAHIESSPYFPAQTASYINVLKKLYESFNMKYETPCYNVQGTDKATERYGLLTTKNTKNEHVFFSTQHTCFVGLLIHAHARLYYRIFRGKDRTRKLAGEFLSRMIKDCDALFSEIHK